MATPQNDLQYLLSLKAELNELEQREKRCERIDELKFLCEFYAEKLRTERRQSKGGAR